MNETVSAMLKAAKDAAETKREKAILLHGLVGDVELAKLDLEARESELMTEICAETNGDGKPRYSNETARKAELAVRIQQDDRYNDCWKVLDAAKLGVTNAQADRDYAHDLHRAYTAAMTAMSGD
ncbi:MAG: hypothetical protein KBC96_15165 [Armatimonadetes bacterium]|nr:hypothetical protein [Armatimonadota bacterium]